MKPLCGCKGGKCPRTQAQRKGHPRKRRRGRKNRGSK